MERAVTLLRNLAFYAAFYLGTIPITLAALVLLPFSQRRFRGAVVLQHWQLPRWRVG